MVHKEEDGDTRMAVAPDIKAEHDASNDHTLQALNQAASRAELAAHKLRANTAIPFSQRDFEAEHPGWSFSKHITSSASTSRPTSSKEVTPSVRPTVLLIDSIPEGPRKRGRPCKARALVHGNLGGRFEGRPEGEGQATKPLEGFFKAYGPRSSQSSKNRQLKAERLSQHPIAIRASAAGDDANGLSNPSSPTEATDPHRDLSTGPSSTSQANSESLRSVYEEVVAPVIQSLARQYEELYPRLDGRAIREEVC